LLTGFESFDVRQAYIWCTAFSAVAFALTAARVRFLPAASDYGLFSWMLSAWCCIAVFSIAVPLTSHFYFIIFLLLVPASWLLYLLTARKLYQRVFSGYPGIAFAGRSSLWIVSIAVPLVVAVSIYFSPGIVPATFWAAVLAIVLLLDRFALFAIAFFLLLLVSVITRYPISIPKNVAIHSFFFGFVLFSQTVAQVADQWTSYRYTSYFNVLVAGCDAIIVTAWALLLTNAGDNSFIRVRPNIKPESELHLLGQLDSLNGILLRAVRK
jgi:hypothetical protein